MMITGVLLALLLAVSFYSDLKHRHIYNALIGPVVLLALLIQLAQGGLAGFQSWLGGLLLGGALLLPPYLMGGMGAGDVKLLAAVGALQGPSFVLAAFIISALIGGLLSLYVLMRKGTTVPYGVAIAAGSVVTVMVM